MGFIFASRRSCASRLRPWRLPLHQLPEVVPLAGAVLLSDSARSLYSGMFRVLALGCVAACSRPPVLGAGLGSVGGAMSVCA